MYMAQILVARPYVIAAPAPAATPGSVRVRGEKRMSFVTYTSGSVDVGDWDLARDRVVDECTR